MRGFFSILQGRLCYVGNSSLGFLSVASLAPKIFYESLFNDSLSEVGNANLISKVRMFSDYGNTGVNRIYSLSNIILGDPIVRIKIPKLPNLRISNANIFLTNQIITDNQDSAEIKIVINNLGRADSSFVSLRVIQSLNSVEIKNSIINMLIPAYSDTLSFWVLTKNLPGEHFLSVEIDPDN